MKSMGEISTLCSNVKTIVVKSQLMDFKQARTELGIGLEYILAVFKA